MGSSEKVLKSVESQLISYTSKENKIGFENLGVWEIGGKTTAFNLVIKQIKENKLLVQAIGRYKKLRIREIRIPLYVKMNYMNGSKHFSLDHMYIWNQEQWFLKV